MPNKSERAYKLNIEEINRQRLKRGWSWSMLAAKLGRDEKTLRRWRKGEPAMLEAIHGIADTFGLSISLIAQEIAEAEKETVNITLKLRVLARASSAEHAKHFAS